MKNFTRDLNCLGYIVLYGTTGRIHLQVYRVDRELEKNNLGEYQLSKPTALRAVCRSAKDIEKDSVHKFARNLVNNQDEKIVVIVRETVDKVNQTVIFEEKTRGRYDKARNSFKASGEDEQKFLDLFNHYKNFVTGDDIRQLARKIVECADGISLRGGEYVADAGGVYFIPRKKIDEMESLKHVLDNLKIGYVKAFCVTDGKSERTDTFEAAIMYFEKQIESIKKGAGKVTSRISALEKYKEQLLAIKAKMDAYARLTGRRENKMRNEFNGKFNGCQNEINLGIKRLVEQKKKKAPGVRVK